MVGLMVFSGVPPAVVSNLGVAVVVEVIDYHNVKLKWNGSLLLVLVETAVMVLVMMLLKTVLAQPGIHRPAHVHYPHPLPLHYPSPSPSSPRATLLPS